MNEDYSQSRKFIDWKRNVEKNGGEIEDVEHVFTRHNHQGQVLFSLLMTRIKTPEGQYIPPILFLKGTVLSVLVCLIDKATQSKYLLVVKQRRICDGSMMLEHPAGMVDGSDLPLHVAIKEVHEETGLKINASQIVCHTPKPIYPSTGTSDEAMLLYSCTLELSLDEILAFDHKHMGVASEHESIVTQVLPFEQAHTEMYNPSAQLLNFLYLKHVGDFALMAKL